MGMLNGIFSNSIAFVPPFVSSQAFMPSQDVAFTSLQMATHTPQPRLEVLKNDDVNMEGVVPFPSRLEEVESYPGYTLSAHNTEKTLTGRSAEFDAAHLQKKIFPWHHLFDGLQNSRQEQPILFTEALQPNWFESVNDCGKSGPFQVHDYFVDLKPTSSGRALNAQVMAPCGLQKFGPSPVVVISPPGFVGELSLPFQQKFYDIQPYISFMRHFASMGFVAVGLFEHRGIVFEDADLVDHKRDAEELKSIADQLLGDESPIREPIVKNELAVMGHSKGGKLSFYHAALDPRVKLVLGIDPVNQGGPPWFVSEHFADHLVAPAPGLTADDEPSLMESVTAKAVIMRAPPDLVNFDARFNAEHFWKAFKGEGVYIDCKVGHGDWLLRQDLRAVTRRVFTAALMDVFHPKKPFSKELRACEIKTKTPHLIKDVQVKHNVVDT